MTESPFSAIEQYKKVFGKQVLIVRPGVSLTIYSASPLRELAPHAADALEGFLAQFPEAVLDAQLGTDKYARFSATAKSKLLAQLRAIPQTYEYMEVHLKDGTDPQCGRYAFHFEATSLNDTGRPLETNLLVFEWPLEFGLASEAAQRVESFCRHIASLVPFTSGTCGFAFQHPQTFPTECLNAIQQLMPRYLGFDPSYRRIRFRMKGHLPTAQWIVLIGSEMTRQHAELDADALRARLPAEVAVDTVADAVLIRAGALPFVGDSNRQAQDLGTVPDVARALQPWRYTISAFGGPRVDADRWLSRFDRR